MKATLPALLLLSPAGLQAQDSEQPDRPDRQAHSEVTIELISQACFRIESPEGTRVLIDRLLEGERPDGYAMEVRSHQAVAASVTSGRADWGVCIKNCARALEFEFLAEERFDFVIPSARWERAPVQAFVRLLGDESIRAALAGEGFLA